MTHLDFYFSVGKKIYKMIKIYQLNKDLLYNDSRIIIKIIKFEMQYLNEYFMCDEQ